MLQVTDPSLLRFLVDVRDADLSDKQLRDDLMTMLIAGHETTAAVLTWTLFALMSNLDVEAKMLEEIDSILGDKTPGDLPVLENGRVFESRKDIGLPQGLQLSAADDKDLVPFLYQIVCSTLGARRD